MSVKLVRFVNDDSKHDLGLEEWMMREKKNRTFQGLGNLEAVFYEAHSLVCSILESH